MSATAWAAALGRYRASYGDWPDFNSASEQHSFLEILEAEVHAQIEADMAKFFYAEAEKIRAAK